MRRSQVRGMQYFDSGTVLSGRVRAFGVMSAGNCKNCGAAIFYEFCSAWVGSESVPVAQTVDLLLRWGLEERDRKNESYGCSSTPSESFCGKCAHTITQSDF